MVDTSIVAIAVVAGGLMFLFGPKKMRDWVKNLGWAKKDYEDAHSGRLVDPERPAAAAPAGNGAPSASATPPTG